MNPETLLHRLIAISEHALDCGNTADEETLREAIAALQTNDTAPAIAPAHARAIEVLQDELGEIDARGCKGNREYQEIAAAVSVLRGDQKIQSDNLPILVTLLADLSAASQPGNGVPFPARRLIGRARDLLHTVYRHAQQLQAALDKQKLHGDILQACLDVRNGLLDTYRDIDTALQEQTRSKAAEIVRLKARLHDLSQRHHTVARSLLTQTEALKEAHYQNAVLEDEVRHWNAFEREQAGFVRQHREEIIALQAKVEYLQSKLQRLKGTPNE